MKAIHRLEKFLKYKELKPMEFEKACGLSNGYFGQKLKAAGAIGSDKLEKIANTHPDLNLNWLITGKGNMIMKPYEIRKEDEKANILEDEQAKYERKTQLANDIQEKFAEWLEIDGVKNKGGRKKKINT